MDSEKNICDLEITGIEFSYTRCRASWSQLLLDCDIDIETVSVLMGHCSTATTNRYYASMKESKAVEHVKTMWSNTVPCVRESTVVRTPAEDKPDNKGNIEESAQEGIRTPGLQLRRLPPYPD